MPVYQTQEEIEQLVQQFEQCMLPGAEWTHAAHLTVALWYLMHHSVEEAAHLMRDGIQRYNASRGIESTLTGGYHETITLFYLRLIDRFLRKAERSAGLPELAQCLIRDFGYKKLLTRYYSRHLLMSPEARFGWVEPDLQRLE